MLENVLVEKYIRQAVSTIQGSIIRNESYNFRCNICGDSKQKNIKRGHIKLSTTDKPFYYYKCFNGDCPASYKPWPVEKWLKQFFPSLYKSYIREIVKSKNENDVLFVKNLNKRIQSFEEEANKEKKRKSLEDEKESVKHFIPILKGDSELFLKAKQYCEQRLLPADIWKRFFVCTKGMYENRLIIPFYDNSNKIYYFQARSLLGQEPKYLNRKCNKDNNIYNIFNIDRDKPVVVFEGPFDSMMVENSIATLGLGISKNTQELLDSLNTYYLFDDDVSGNKMAIKYLQKGKPVFLWSKFKKDFELPTKDKWDFNDVYIYLNRKQMFVFDDITKYFTNNIYDRIYL